ncbi:hypothetical protein GCM10010193_58050 [Kitasatospora atroaurantiaca]|uniref:hypothetical protein n=1 Tax=Kitasatospora atroaurantiaca TaxID=285545 RepID=UPI00119DAAEF|nr:hypothetical protein [Kitasatospora atroaurantiaca]
MRHVQVSLTDVLQGGVISRVPLPRKDLTVVSQGVTIKPGLSVGGYAAFALGRPAKAAGPVAGAKKPAAVAYTGRLDGIGGS